MKITLSEWAARNYSPAPSMFTLRQWARSGSIWPAPEKAGKAWYVDENAKRIDAAASSGLTLVQRLQSSRA